MDYMLKSKTKKGGKDGNYKESDQLISGVAKQFNLFKKMEERVINADKYK